jgi:lipoprotein-anchoring transpeptidase ErfK/SrfK
VSNPSTRVSVLRKSWIVAALLAVLALVVSACSSDSSGPGTSDSPSAPASQDGQSSSSAEESSSASPTKTEKPKTAVKITTLNSDGVTYGVGMPVIVYFSKKITDGKQWQADTKVTANGKPLETAWYFQYSSAGRGPIEAQLRPQTYWPAHSRIKVTFPSKGTPLGRTYVSDGKLTSLDFQIGPRNIVTVDDGSNRVNVVSDGKQWGSFPTSLGAPNTRTQRGVKVIMEKGLSICMSGPGYNECNVKYTQRLTYGGEYLHQAEWNIRNINAGINSSNGCTNLLPTDAAKLYGFLRVGDVVNYPNADGPMMQMGQGYGLWNVSWGEYQTGGLVPTR